MFITIRSHALPCGGQNHQCYIYYVMSHVARYFSYYMTCRLLYGLRQVEPAILVAQRVLELRNNNNNMIGHTPPFTRCANRTGRKHCKANTVD